MRRTLLTLAGAMAFLAAPAASAQAPEANAAEAPGSAAHLLAGFGKPPEAQAVFDSWMEVMRRYEQESLDYQSEVQAFLEQTYQQRRNALAAAYEDRIQDLELKERRERLDAIAQFEEFLRRYPDDPHYTPDVMFRLAELYFERSSDDQLVAMRDFEQQAMAAAAKGASYPAEPRVDFSPSIALYQRLIREFPDYRFNDGAHYLQGYCLEKQDQLPEALAQYETLIARYPDSRFATEAWVRIGEYHFDAEPTEQVARPLERAAEAYEAAIRDTDHPLYDKALYKLGWVYYRIDRFNEAVDRFMTLADFYEARAKAEGGDAVGGDLREEALQYIAISLIDEKFAGSVEAQAAYAKLEQRPYGADIWRRLANLYFDQTRHEEAIAAYRRVLSMDPLRKDAPALQERIAQAYERDRRLSESFAEGEKLATMFAEGTAWHTAHRDDPDTLALAEEKAEKALYGAALFHHQQALVYKEEARTDPSRAELAKRTFENAAQAYGRYLERFPRSRNAYEMAYYRGETLYNSLQFREAAAVYEAVRDDGADVKYRKDAALSAVYAWMRVREEEVRLGRIPDLKPLRSDEREGRKAAPTPLSGSEQRLIAASDTFVTQHPEAEQAPELSYKAAELYYAHDDFPEARRRFEALVGRYPDHEVARYATNLIVESYLVDEDWAAVERVAGRLAQNSEVAGKGSELEKELTRFKLAGRFKLAEEHFAAGAYEEAADKYIALVDEEPQHEFADKALNNAAVSYEKVRRFDSALRLYERIVKEYPKSDLADDALFRVAVNAEQSYDFDKAVDRYEALVRDYPASPDREAALFNTARLLEAQQRYPEAARAFIRYAELYPESEDAPKNQYRAALIYEKQGDWRGAIRSLDAFVSRFSRRPAQAELVVDAKKRIGLAYQKLDNPRLARQAFTEAAQFFDARKLVAEEHLLAADAAAHARFQLAEEELAAFEKLKISGGGKRLVQSLNRKKEALKKAADAYTTVFRYKRLDWILAAQYRRGHLLQRYATTLIETPVPPEVERLGVDEVVAYQELVANEALQFEDQAAEAYAQTVKVARENRVHNDWTRRTLEALNRIRPNEYPVLKEPKRLLSDDALLPTVLLRTAPASPKAEAPTAEKAP
ncbi:MAG TPA: tetratricopeptide repeat protein [Myxococcaceae bacterium]|nr:tetratricopeptide repeat protein [Myxococcaceae bacterium]